MQPEVRLRCGRELWREQAQQHSARAGAGWQAHPSELCRCRDEEQIDDRLARRAHELEGRLAKLGTAGITKPKDLLEFVNNLKYKTVGGQQLTADCMFCGCRSSARESACTNLQMFLFVG